MQSIPTDSAAAAESVGEQELEPAEEAEPKAFSTLLSQATGKSAGRSREDVKIAETFTALELEIMDEYKVTKAQMLVIAKLKSEEERLRVMNAIVMSMTFDEAMKYVKDNPKQTEEMKAKKVEKTMGAKEWLEFYCTKIRPKLEDTSCYDRDALLYRDTREDRNVCRGRTKAAGIGARRAGYSPYAELLCKFIFLLHPDNWVICEQCFGKNKQKPECKGCYGCGYRTMSEKAKYVK